MMASGSENLVYDQHIRQLASSILKVDSDTSKSRNAYPGGLTSVGNKKSSGTLDSLMGKQGV